MTQTNDEWLSDYAGEEVKTAEVKIETLDKLGDGDYYNGGLHGHQYGDLQWVESQIDLMRIMAQKTARARYREIFRELDGADNQRFRVNSWLRASVNKNKPVVDNSNLPF